MEPIHILVAFVVIENIIQYSLNVYNLYQIYRNYSYNLEESIIIEDE